MEESFFYAGKINIHLFKLISCDITTDEVIITSERIEHIEDHHPGDYKRYSQFIPELLLDPDFILKDKHEDTAIVVKEFVTDHRAFRLTLRLHTSKDIAGRKNSILSFQYIREKEYRRLKKQKSLVYKKEKN